MLSAAYRTTTTHWLNERELSDWYGSPAANENHHAGLFVSGTHCLLNGQRALWCVIYNTYFDGSPTVDAMTWLERSTAAARRSLEASS